MIADEDAFDMLAQMGDAFPQVMLAKHDGMWWLSCFTERPDGTLESAVFEYDADRNTAIGKGHIAWRKREAA